jgi:hypothetical protein
MPNRIRTGLPHLAWPVIGSIHEGRSSEVKIKLVGAFFALMPAHWNIICHGRLYAGHPRLVELPGMKTWMPATSAGMTK